MCDNIEWAPVQGYEGLYEVSSHGDVRHAVKGNILRHFATSRGYRVVKLFAANVGKNHKVHRLVASAFIRAPLEDEQVNHRDLDKANNCFRNLEWVSNDENVAHYVANRPADWRANWSLPKPYPRARMFGAEQEVAICAAVAAGKSRRTVAKELGVSRTTISRIVLSHARCSSPGARPETAVSSPAIVSGHPLPAGAFGAHLSAPALLGREARSPSLANSRPSFFIQER